MLSDDDLPKLPGLTKLHTVLPDDYRYGYIYGFTIGQMRKYARAVERKAYERAAAECRAVAVDFRRTGNQCTDGRYDWKADSAEDCAVAIEALGREE